MLGEMGLTAVMDKLCTYILHQPCISHKLYYVD